MNTRRLWLISAAIFIVATLALTAVLWITVSRGFFSACVEPLSAEAFSRCDGTRSFNMDQATLLITILGIAVSSIATIALLVTIYFTTRATEAAVKASDAAYEAIHLSRDAMEVELRPYVTLKQIHFKRAYGGPNGEISEFYFEAEWENVGATPAMKVQASANILVGAEALPAEFKFPPKDKDSPAGTLGRQSSIQSTSPTITPQEVDEAINKTKTIHLWSTVEYRGRGERIYKTEYYVTIGIWGGNCHTDDLKSNRYLKRAYNGMDETCNSAIQMTHN